jgi:hypothetical protein
LAAGTADKRVLPADQPFLLNQWKIQQNIIAFVSPNGIFSWIERPTPVCPDPFR